MKPINTLLLLVLISIGKAAPAQELSQRIINAVIIDDSVQLEKFINKDNVNTCYGDYSTLSQTIRYNAKKCFFQLLGKGADVNKICNGYVPPLMHAVKYGRLDMVKALVEKGADFNYKYDGDNPIIKDMTPLTYAEKFHQIAIADYLRSIKK